MAEVAMADTGLFGDLPESAVADRRKSASKARLREPERDQTELRAVDLDSVIDTRCSSVC